MKVILIVLISFAADFGCVSEENMMQLYIEKLHSDNPKEQVNAVDGLLRRGEKGIDSLARNLKGGREAAEFLARHWDGIDKFIKDGRYSEIMIGEARPLHIAVAKNYSDAVKLLIAKGADIRGKTNHSNSHTPLSVAAHYGRVDIARYLVSKGVGVNEWQYYPGHTLLHEAAANGNAHFVEFLIENGADIHAETYKGSMPIHFANGEAIRALVELGEDVNAEGFAGQRPLHTHQNREDASLLLDFGADIEAKDSGGCTPLHYAAESEKIDFIKFLIENGADINARDNVKRTALHRIIRNIDFQTKDTIVTLIELGAEINAKDSQGKTPLHLAVECSVLKENALLLIEKGADLNAVDNEGKTPLEYADEEIKSLLRSHSAKTGKELQKEGK